MVYEDLQDLNENLNLTLSNKRVAEIKDLLLSNKYYFSPLQMKIIENRE